MAKHRLQKACDHLAAALLHLERALENLPVVNGQVVMALDEHKRLRASLHRTADVISTIAAHFDPVETP